MGFSTACGDTFPVFFGTIPDVLKPSPPGREGNIGILHIPRCLEDLLLPPFLGFFCPVTCCKGKLELLPCPGTEQLIHPISQPPWLPFQTSWSWKPWKISSCRCTWALLISPVLLFLVLLFPNFYCLGGVCPLPVFFSSRCSGGRDPFPDYFGNGQSLLLCSMGFLKDYIPD